jgi:hypothetical protein
MTRMRSAMCMSAAMMFAAVTLTAQDAMDKPAGKMDKKAQSMTGCVQAGSSPGTFMLTNATPTMGDEKMGADAMGAAKAGMGPIMLSAMDVDLAAHVGHKVTVTGTMSGKMKHDDMMKDDKAKDADKTAASGMESAAAGPTLKVKSVTMVASTCS